MIALFTDPETHPQRSLAKASFLLGAALLVFASSPGQISFPYPLDRSISKWSLLFFIKVLNKSAIVRDDDNGSEKMDDFML